MLVEVGALISWCIYSYRIVMLLVPYMWASMTFLPYMWATMTFWPNSPYVTFLRAQMIQISQIRFYLPVSAASWKGAFCCASSETQGQLVGTTGFSWAKVYNKSGSAPGHLLLPNELQKRLKSRLLIGQKNFFLANQRRGTAGRLSCLLTRGCFPHQSP